RVRLNRGDPAEAISALAVSPDGKTLAFLGRAAGLLDMATGRHLGWLGRITGCGLCLGFTPDGKSVVGLGPQGRLIHFCDAITGKSVRRLPCPGGGDVYIAVQLSPDGKVLALAHGSNSHNTVRLLDAVTGKELRRWPGDDGPVYLGAFT